MALRKPSNFFEDKDKSEVSKSIKDTESFDTFQTYKKNVEKFDAISKFSGSLEDYNENVEKVNYLSQQLLGVQEEIKTLLTKEDLDRAMMSQLLVVEETANDIQSRVKTINNEKLVGIKQNVKELTEQVNQFVSIDVPKYKKLVSESEIRVDDRFVKFKEEIEENFDLIKSDTSKEVASALETVESLNENIISDIKSDFRKTTKDVNNTVSDLVEKELPKYKKFFAETEIRTEEKIKTSIDS